MVDLQQWFINILNIIQSGIPQDQTIYEELVKTFSLRYTNTFSCEEWKIERKNQNNKDLFGIDFYGDIIRTMHSEDTTLNESDYEKYRNSLIQVMKKELANKFYSDMKFGWNWEESKDSESSKAYLSVPENTSGSNLKFINKLELNKDKYFLDLSPSTLVFHILWGKSTTLSILNLLHMTPSTFHLKDLLMNVPEAQNKEYLFRGIICYSNMHYFSYIRHFYQNEDRETWIEYNDAHTEKLTWAQVMYECVYNGYTPILLIFEDVEGEDWTNIDDLTVTLDTKERLERYALDPKDEAIKSLINETKKFKQSKKHRNEELDEKKNQEKPQKKRKSTTKPKNKNAKNSSTNEQEADTKKQKADKGNDKPNDEGGNSNKEDSKSKDRKWKKLKGGKSRKEGEIYWESELRGNEEANGTGNIPQRKKFANFFNPNQEVIIQDHPLLNFDDKLKEGTENEEEETEDQLTRSKQDLNNEDEESSS